MRPKLTTTVYKYHPFARLILVLYIVALLSFFLFSSRLSDTEITVGAIIIFGFPIFSAASSRSPFALRSIDKNLLVITEDQLSWGELTIPLNQLQDVSVYLHAFETLIVHGPGQSIIREFGDRNKLVFDLDGHRYEFTFFLNNYLQYAIAMEIFSSWRSNIPGTTVRVAYEHDYILRQMSLFGTPYD